MISYTLRTLPVLVLRSHAYSRGRGPVSAPTSLSPDGRLWYKITFIINYSICITVRVYQCRYLHCIDIRYVLWLSFINYSPGVAMCVSSIKSVFTYSNFPLVCVLLIFYSCVLLLSRTGTGGLFKLTTGSSTIGDVCPYSPAVLFFWIVIIIYSVVVVDKELQVNISNPNLFFICLVEYKLIRSSRVDNTN
jgi:hypothetical protein